MNEQPNLTNEPSTATPKRPKTMSPAAIAANRANALKSTGPRTTAGKLKAASNSLKHGLYAMRNFDHFIHDHDIALDVAINFVEQFQPVTPTEVALVHQLIHMQVRFLQTEYLYGQAMRARVDDILTKPSPMLPALLRELDRLPARIQRTIKTLRAEIAQREATTGENVEIEPIPSPPKLPNRPTCETYVDNKSQLNPHTEIDKTKPSAGYLLAEELVKDFIDTMNLKNGIQPDQPADDPQQKS